MVNDLSHVYWLGGGPCSGKTTVSDVIGTRRDVLAYHVDQHREEIHAPCHSSTPSAGTTESGRLQFRSWDSLGPQT